VNTYNFIRFNRIKIALGFHAHFSDTGEFERRYYCNRLNKHKAGDVAHRRALA
jgi:hypothetical protein